MTFSLAKCRHNQSSPAGMCELQPGVLVCPCLGPNAAPAGKLFVDDAGQLVWTAYAPNGDVKAHHTYVALRKGADGRSTAVQLAVNKNLTPDPQQCVFHVRLRGDNAAATIRVDEFMRRSLAGEEFVYLT